MSLKWKVCGMRENQNIKEVLALEPDYMGFIFYDKSKRYADPVLDKSLLASFSGPTQKVGVFVNAEESYILLKVVDYGLQMLQLHGEESPAFCQNLRTDGLKVMKAFAIDESFDFAEITPFLEVCDYFLFDTKAPNGYGGHGKKFDWTLLNQYKHDVPFLLAGGVDLESLSIVKELKHPAFMGVDVNSKFEQSPALKDLVKLKILKKELTGNTLD
ncbi:MAG: phosphoribosylanthranilate isomerase [Arcticibacterium sp.]|jgi:phosphoribosylanthranilate isomerase